jgi:uncharacterized protein YukE
MKVTFETAKAKETRINKALAKVNQQLQDFKQESEKIQGNWTDADRLKFDKWNNWHDLHDRLNARLMGNYFNWQHQQFIETGIAIYNF